MKRFLFVSCLLTGAAWAQAPEPASVPSSVNPETVVAVIDGKKVTAGELELILARSPQARQNPQAFLTQYGMMMHLSRKAEEAKLDQVSPNRERLELMRMQALAQIQVDEHYKEVLVTPEEQREAYEANRGKYEEAKIRALRVPFSVNAPAAPAGSNVLTEEQAREKAAELVKKAREGADFVALMKENGSGEGEMSVTRSDANIPAAILDAIFALEQGGISEPIRQPNGYYVFKIEQLNRKSYDEVKDAIYNELKEKKVGEWVESVQKGIKIKIENEAFFTPPATPAMPAGVPPPGN
ncbi:MAG: peptidylprolyl isomerase [Bryobacteraceae bacterium]